MGRLLAVRQGLAPVLRLMAVEGVVFLVCAVQQTLVLLLAC
jgi:hypothetical protein